MTPVKLLALAVGAATLLMAFSSSALGTTVTSNGATYTGTIKAASENGHISLHGSNGVEIECASSVEGKVEAHGSGVTASGKLSSLTFTSCTGGDVVHVKKAGTLIAHTLSGGNATITSSGAEIEVTANIGSGSLTCIYTTNNTHLGTLTGSTATKGKATLDIAATIPRTGGSSLCGATGIMTGAYVVNTPENLIVHDTAGPPGTTVTSNGATYTGTIKAASENGHISLHGSNDVTTECSSSIEGNVKSHGPGVPAAGPITDLSFTGCTNGYLVHVEVAGSLTAHSIAGSPNATITSTGAEILVTAKIPFGSLSCIYTTNNTHLGTLTGSTATGGKATLDISAVVPRTGGSGLCGATGTLTGSYAVNSPGNLNFHDVPGPPGTTLTANGSVYTGTIKAASENGHISLHGSNGVTTECSSSIEGKVESHGPGVTAEGAISALSFTGCTDSALVHVKKAGSLIAHYLEGGNATIASTGAEIEATTKTIFGIITCIYTTSNTHLGTLTGSATTKGKATLDIAATIPRTGGSSICGSTGNWTGAYVVNTPENLDVDEV